MLFHVIQHDRSGNEALAAQRAGVRTFSGMISTMDGERGRLCKRFPAHGTKIRSLPRVNTLVHHVILPMGETFTANVADQRPGPVHRLVRVQRLDGRELLRARVARIRGYRFVRRRRGTANTAGDRITGRHYRVRNPIVSCENRLMSLCMMIVQISRLEAHQTPRARVRFLLADLVHPSMPFEQRTIPETRRATIAGERFLDVHRRRYRWDRCAGRYRRQMRDLVHSQVTQSEECP